MPFNRSNLAESVELFRAQYDRAKKIRRVTVGLQALALAGSITVSSNILNEEKPWLDVSSFSGRWGVVLAIGCNTVILCMPLHEMGRRQKNLAGEAQANEVEQAIAIGRPVPEYARPAMSADDITLEVADEVF